MNPLTEVDYLKRILQANVYDVANKTELMMMPKLSKNLGNQIWLKREDQQPVKSFKLRGASNKLNNLTEEQQKAGVVAASAGNHAQGVAYCANEKRIYATIIMPKTTPEIKIDAVKLFGGDYVKVVLHGNDFDAANAHAKSLSNQFGYTLVPPFDDPDVIVGQGTIAKELLEQNNNLNTVFIAVGGGGLAAGMALYIKQVRPDIRIISVEAEDSNCYQAAINHGAPIELNSVGIFADGVAVKKMGEETFRLCSQYIDECITVTNDEICAAIKEIYEDTRVIAEPAGAISVAGISKYVKEHSVSNEQLAGILCGANTNFHTLRYVSERCELGEQKEAILAVRIPEKKGAFKFFCQLFEDRMITEFNYRYGNEQEAHIFVGFKLAHGLTELAHITDSLTQHDYTWFDLSEDETAKLHVRYMVGGRPAVLQNEHIFTFTFPERPGALLRFLNTLGERWNITLFHYRNHGAAQGLVLAGFEVPQDQWDEFESHRAKLGYESTEQTTNPAYQFFLSSLG
jgi:threonine dehydratase